ncbi:uncharacterized protein LOC127714496 [Mytilus californianus]|uniref:uncharacterized protein LOC127714496 n=1 Tax=Mytilus californianus TaxID=6549 RepID=UPI00224645B9|nr:uncharacterized protein LOC127714496 [Mytilus californianus]
MLVFWLLTLKCWPLIFKHQCSDVVKTPPEDMDENIEDKSATVETNVHNKVKMPSYIQEFQNETLRDWASKLDKFVKTRAADVIYNHTKTETVILIVGPTGTGKSSLAYYAAFKLKEEAGYTILPVRKPVDITNYHVPGTKQIFLVDDFIGKYAVDEKEAVSWEENGPLLKIIVSKRDQTKIILTSRTYIWQQEWYKYLNIPSYTCDLLSENLQLLAEERLNIFKSYINTDVSMALNEDDIMLYNIFLSVCAMYSSSKKYSLKKFLEVPFLIIENEIDNFKTKSQVRFIALAILAIKHIISINSLTINKHEHDDLLQDLFHESTFVQNQSKNLLKSTLAAFKGEYVREEHGCFEFIHKTMRNIVLCCIAKTFMKSVIKYCEIDVILNQIRLYCISDEQDVYIIKVTRENTNAYFRRLVTELKKGFHKQVFESAQNVVPQFRAKFLEHIKLNITCNELTKTKEGMTALHVVSALGYHEYVSFFIQYERMINERDTAGNIPLHLACKKGHLEIVKDLVENNSLVDIPNHEELKPFFYACENNSVDVAKYMLHYSGIKVNEKYSRKNKRCVLHVVCANGYTDLAILLLKNNAKVDVKDADECTPLHLACYNGNSGTVSALLNSSANVDAVDLFGKTSVYIACSANHERVLQLLLDKKAVVNQKTDNGMTPLRVSCKNGNTVIVKMLLQSGAKVNSNDQSAVPLHDACKVGNESIIDILIHAKASVNQKTQDGITPLHEACRKGHANVVKILLDNKAVVNEQDKTGGTALSISSFKGFYTIIDLLLQKGAKPNISDEDKVNSLKLACKENHKDVVD